MAARSCRACSRASRSTSSRCSKRSASTRRGSCRMPRSPISSSTPVPGAGSCGGMYTANTMASAIEALGLSLPNSSAQAAISDDKKDDCVRAGAAVANLIEKNIRPRDILTKKAFENAIVTISALGGSTNAVLHLLAIAHAAGVKLSIDDFTRIGKRAPVRRRPQAERQVRDGGADQDRRPDAAHEAPARSRPAARRRDDGDGQDACREPARCAGLSARSGQIIAITRSTRSRKTATS